MPDFEPRMDKWGSETFSGLGASLKDDIVNKGRLQRTRKRAAKQAARRARWKRSWLGRLVTWLWMWVWRIIGLGLLFVIARFLWENFQLSEMFFS